ncbi:hypothetical protein D3C81_2267660 [compost metagenome]
MSAKGNKVPRITPFKPMVFTSAILRPIAINAVNTAITACDLIRFIPLRKELIVKPTASNIFQTNKRYANEKIG